MGLNDVFLTASPGRDFDSEDRILGLLPVGESARVSKMRRPADRVRSALGRLLASVAVADVLDVPPRSVAFTVRDQHAKPVCNYPIETSIAHCDTAVVAVASHDTIGIDIEQQRGSTGAINVALSDDENEWVLRQLHKHQFEAPLRIWTIKEAMFKAAGSGIVVNPRRLDISHQLYAMDSSVGEPVWETNAPTWDLEWTSTTLRVDQVKYFLATAQPSTHRKNIRQLTVEELLRTYEQNT